MSVRFGRRAASGSLSSKLAMISPPVKVGCNVDILNISVLKIMSAAMMISTPSPPKLGYLLPTRHNAKMSQIANVAKVS